MTQNIAQGHLIFSQLIKSQLYTEKSNFTLKSQTLTFLSKSSVKDHNSSKHVKIWNLFIKKSRNQDSILKKSKFLNLKFFLSVENFLFFHNFEPNFHHNERWFKRKFQQESWRYPWNLQLYFTQLLVKTLGVIILWIHAHELKKA